jgi:hypothetical protein
MQVRYHGMQYSEEDSWSFDIVDYLHIPVLFSREASNVVAARNARPNFLKIGESKKFVILRLLLIMEHPAADGFQKNREILF